MCETDSSTMEDTVLASANRTRRRYRRYGCGLESVCLPVALNAGPQNGKSRRVFEMQVTRRLMAGYLYMDDKVDSNVVERCSHGRLWTETLSTLGVMDER